MTTRAAILLVALSTPAAAQEGGPDMERPCENTRDADNCSRVLACIGRDGLWFDGRADGWDVGTLEGRLSDGELCEGHWGYVDANSALAELRCEDGLVARIEYVAQDPETGTGLGRGVTNDGRAVEAWTGRNVLDFLTPEGGRVPVLPCGGEVPIS